MGLLLAVVSAVFSLTTPPFHGTASPIGPELRARMTGVSWHPGCPVPLSGLRLLTVSYRGFDGRRHTGRLVVGAPYARPVLDVFRRLYAARFPIRRM